VTDQSGGSLPGVTVEITSPNLQGMRARHGQRRRYCFVSVPPGPYKVTANLSGMGTSAKTTNVTLDSTATVNLQMTVSAKEAITVTGEAPLVDTTSTTTGTSYQSKVIDKLPVQRNYASIVLSQPGVQTDSGETQGRSLALSVYGSTSAENLFLIDGVNTTNVIKGFQGKALNAEFIQEVEVKTGGYQAEYGRNTGGIVNVITKSGSNEFHGEAFTYSTGRSFQADQKFEVTAPGSQDGDVTVNTAGTIIKDVDRREFEWTSAATS
jgi:outer membrane receptor for ferrienterochelin and colicin